MSNNEFTRVECATCGWSNEAYDKAWVEHSGKVHVTSLKPGHVLKTPEPTLRDQIREIMDRGNVIYEWPEDEAEAYRELRWAEGHAAAVDIRITKIIALFDARREEIFRKGMERGFIGAKGAVESMQVGEPFTVHSVLHQIKSAKNWTLAQEHNMSELYFGDS